MTFKRFANFQVTSAVLVPQDATKAGLRALAKRHEFKYDPRPGFLYVRSRAISSRTNDNFDTFPAEEIKQAYSSFIGKPVFVNHVNDNHKRARGIIIDAALHEDTLHDGSPDTWAEVLMEVDAKAFPKLAKAILTKRIDRTSMGCDVAYSICSACGNKASTPSEYCAHIPRLKGKKIIRRNAATGAQEPHLIHEICHGLGFFENSLLVEEPADPTAYTWDAHMGEDPLPRVGDHSGMQVAASRETVSTPASPRQTRTSLASTSQAPAGQQSTTSNGLFQHFAGEVVQFPSKTVERKTGTDPHLHEGIGEDPSAPCVHCGWGADLYHHNPDRVAYWHSPQRQEDKARAKAEYDRRASNYGSLSPSIIKNMMSGEMSLGSCQHPSHESGSENVYARNPNARPATSLGNGGHPVCDEHADAFPHLPGAQQIVDRNLSHDDQVADDRRRTRIRPVSLLQHFVVEAAAKKVWWHGTPYGGPSKTSGEHGVHVGTKEAARQALHANIGHRADGKDWDGTQEYGKTLLAGHDTIKGLGRHVTGYSAGYSGRDWGSPSTREAVKDDHFPSEATGAAIPLDAKPHLFPVHITGPMSNDESRPHKDFAANGRMKSLIQRGQARRGYFYKNEGEDVGSISAVVPSWDHLTLADHKTSSLLQHFAAAKPDAPTHSGVVLKAADTGRVLMLQRSMEDEKDPAKGTWEFPGGGHEDGDHTSLHAGIREWEEEVGQEFPQGGTVSHTWRSPNGVYQGHVVTIPEEKQVVLHQGRVKPNPDDPDGDNAEQAAWWDPKHAEQIPNLRREVKKSPWDEIRKAASTEAAKHHHRKHHHHRNRASHPHYVPTSGWRGGWGGVGWFGGLSGYCCGGTSCVGVDTIEGSDGASGGAMDGGSEGSRRTAESIPISDDDREFYRQIHHQNQQHAEMKDHADKRVVNLDDPHDLKQHMLESHDFEHDDFWRNSHAEDHPALGPSGDDDRHLTHSEIRMLHDHDHEVGDYSGTTMGGSHFHTASRRTAAGRGPGDEDLYFHQRHSGPKEIQRRPWPHSMSTEDLESHLRDDHQIHDETFDFAKDATESRLGDGVSVPAYGKKTYHDALHEMHAVHHEGVNFGMDPDFEEPTGELPHWTTRMDHQEVPHTHGEGWTHKMHYGEPERLPAASPGRGKSKPSKDFEPFDVFGRLIREALRRTSAKVSYEKHEIPAHQVQVGDRLDIMGKTRVSKTHIRDGRVHAQTKTTGTRSPSGTRWEHDETVKVYRPKKQVEASAEHYPHCIVCGDDMRVNPNTHGHDGKPLPNEGWYHADGMKRGHPPIPHDDRTADEQRTKDKAGLDQARMHMRDTMRKQFDQIDLGHQVNEVFGLQKCPTCRGGGWDPTPRTSRPCSTCDGEGSIKATSSLTKTADDDQCPYCAGDSIPSGNGYVCEDGHHWRPEDDAAQAYHGDGPERGQIQPTASYWGDEDDHTEMPGGATQGEYKRRARENPAPQVHPMKSVQVSSDRENGTVYKQVQHGHPDYDKGVINTPSPEDQWHGPYRVIQHPETQKFHVVDNQNRMTRFGPRRGMDEQHHAEERRDYADQRQQSKERAKSMADGMFDGMAKAMGYENHEDAQNQQRTDRNIGRMNELASRYEGGTHHPLTPGKFGADDVDKKGDGEGEPYYEVSDPGGSGWKARDYGGSRIHIHHEAMEHAVDSPEPHGGETGGWSTPGLKRPGFDHEDLHQELHHWIHGDPADGDDKYGAGPDYARNEPAVERWQKRNRYKG